MRDMKDDDDDDDDDGDGDGDDCCRCKGEKKEGNDEVESGTYK
jgi:hypothetical protein